MSQNYDFIKKMTPEQVAKYYKNRKPFYRRLLSKFTSLLKMFFGKTFRTNVATASGVRVSTVRGGNDDGQSANGYGLTVQKLKIPGKRQLQKNLDALGMRDALDELEAMLVAMRDSENKSLNAIFEDMKHNHTALTAAYEESLHAMAEVAEGFIPDEVNDIFMRVKKYFDKMEKAHVKQRDEAHKAAVKAAKDAGLPAPKQEEEDELAYYLNVGTRDGGMDFVLNCDITHWRNVVDGVHKALLVVVTVRAEPTETAHSLKAYVNILDRVALPYLNNLGTEIPGGGTADIGGKFTSMIDREIARHNVVLFATKAELKLDATEVQTVLGKIEGVTGVTVEPNEVILEFPDNDRAIQTEVLRVLGNLRQVKALVKKGYIQSLNNIDVDVHSYSLTLK